MFTLVCHPREMANKINVADHILITLRFSSLSNSNAREVIITLGFQAATERADSPVREILCLWFVYVIFCGFACFRNLHVFVVFFLQVCKFIDL